MALIKCSECGHEVSDKASACPNCGCPIENRNCCIECGQPIPNGVYECPNCGCPTQDYLSDGFESTKKSKSGLLWFISILTLAVLLGGGYYFYKRTYEVAEKKVNDINIDSLLVNGQYTFEGYWESSSHSAQPCKLEFEKNGKSLEKCAYTNLKYNARIPLNGTIQSDTLHFVGDILGKQLVIDLKITDNGNSLVGEGIDYAHSGDKARLNLTTATNKHEIEQPQTTATNKHEIEQPQTTVQEEKKEQVEISRSQFVGTYKFSATRQDYKATYEASTMKNGGYTVRQTGYNTPNGYTTWVVYLVVREDGRVVKICPKQDAKYVGTIKPINSTAFSFVDYDRYAYIGEYSALYKGNDNRIGSLGKDGYDFWRGIVFDVANNRVYKTKMEYENRDISASEFIKFTYTPTVELSNNTDYNKED